MTADQSPRPEDHARTASRPSELKITDLRTATVGWDNWFFTIVRIDTNQGISGYGEVRDFASKTYALMLKSRLLGENPCNVDKLFRKIKQFGHHGRQAGGVCGVEMALLDLAGKAYGVPAYVLAGGKFRDRIRMYCDTPNEDTGTAMGKKLQERLDRGFTMLKMDVGVQPLIGKPGMLSWPQGMLPGDPEDKIDRMLNIHQLQHPFTHVRLTPKGIDSICQYVAEVRQTVGDEVPIAADHFGHIGIDDCIRLGQALEPYNLAWLEDMVPWQYTDKWVQLERALNTPVCTGEDIYLAENFRPLIQARGVNIIHPDLATSGGILETKKIGDLAQEHGISMALHMAGTPVSTMASVHCAAATENFIALEHHFTEMPFWSDFISIAGETKPIIERGYIRVPEGPGLGFELNEDVLREHLVEWDKGLFEPTPDWDRVPSHDRLWS
ncbi:MAG TPA: mandelate racemase/muconate lactonizing enzyme family protein [Kouleothrix sp.]|uniref:mandelate racemase/muconate lactonizing enzyme family protein n=1 Tax=Kouleothrix sp. TaxID=2779161 RepID=UPI002CA32BEE|nr:mandelate racemase/muconate lactonizing enzyme family protein [Kouleothrix sp.]HRC74422.1 mandelate racemase/muconate lactonizing enzyme family protein [Kouleothrix sp.]